LFLAGGEARLPSRVVASNGSFVHPPDAQINRSIGGMICDREKAQLPTPKRTVSECHPVRHKSHAISRHPTAVCERKQP